jgi:hypothetical protein
MAARAVPCRAVQVFASAGLSSPIAASIITGGVNLAVTLAAAAALDRCGRMHSAGSPANSTRELRTAQLRCCDGEVLSLLSTRCVAAMGRKLRMVCQGTSTCA